VIIEVSNLKINVEESGSGKPVVLLHGWGTDASSWVKVVETLNPSFHIYSIDLPGFGKSSLPQEVFGISDYVETLKEIFKALKIKDVLLIGHSFGGNLAWVFAAKYPESVKKLVLVNSSGIRKQSGKVKLISSIANLTPNFIKAPFRKEIYNLIGEHDYETSGPLKESFKKIVNDDQSNLLTKIEIPTLIIWGEDDKDVPVSHAYKYRSEIKNSKLYILPAAGHFSFLDRPNDFNKLLINFLND